MQDLFADIQNDGDMGRSRERSPSLSDMPLSKRARLHRAHAQPAGVQQPNARRDNVLVDVSSGKKLFKK